MDFSLLRTVVDDALGWSQADRLKLWVSGRLILLTVTNDINFLLSYFNITATEFNNVLATQGFQIIYQGDSRGPLGTCRGPRFT